MSGGIGSTKQVAALTGSIDAIPLFDLCQFLLLNRRTGTLTVRRDDSTIRIYFEEGKILDITDDALHSGERLLVGAVQWKSGSFDFDPRPTGVEPRIEASTESILLDAARTIDEFRARSGEGSESRSQESIFRERQTFAGELADAFRVAIDPMERSVGSGDPLTNLLEDLQRLQGTLLLRGKTALLREGEGVRPYTIGVDAEEMLQRLHMPSPGEGETHNHRFEKPPGWYHLRSRRVGGELQIVLASLLSEIPRPQKIGLDPNAYEPLLADPGGLILWTGIPRGYRSTALACWLGHSNGSKRGLTLWLEESPRIAWEVASWISRHVGEPHDSKQVAGILEWAPEILVVDPVRIPGAARLALEVAEAGTTTVAIGIGLTLEAALERFIDLLRRSGLADVEARLGRNLAGWVGVLPLIDEDLDRPVAATQVVRADRRRPTGFPMGDDVIDLAEWIENSIVTPEYSSEIERQEQEGTIPSGLRIKLRRNFPGLGI